MATTYKVAQGHDNTAGLATLDPQPRTTTPMQWTEVQTISGAVIPQGMGSVDFVWGAFQTYTAMETLLTAFGFTFANGMPDNYDARVTVAIRGMDGTSYQNYNARARLLPLQRGSGYFENVTIQIYRAIKI